MRKKWFALGCLTSILILFGSIFLISRSVGKLMNKEKGKIDPNSYLFLNISGQIPEYSVLTDDFFGETQLTAHDIIQRIKRAAYDDNIRGIVIEAKGTLVGFSTANEICLAIEDFKRISAKPVYSYIEYAGNKDYLLSSVADKIYLNPALSSGILLTGIGSNWLFYKEMLEKIGVEAIVVQSGKYKGAGEMFSETQMSEPLKESLTALYSSIYDTFIENLAKNRSLSIDKIKWIFEERDDIFVNGQKAIEYGLVDELAYKEDIWRNLNIKKDQLLAIKKYAPFNTVPRGSEIAVVYAQGNISTKRNEFDFNVISASDMAKTLDEIEKNQKIAAVVIRVNSPGGSALESDIILDRIRKLKEKKRVVISMGDVAASGGYYISCDSDYIFVDPYTITGSIGVISMIPNFSKLSDKVGLHSDGVTFGKYSNFLNPWQKANPEEIDKMQKFSTEIYNEFKSRVANGRELETEYVEKIAQGRVWSANDAVNIKLADQVGTLSAAIEKAAQLSNQLEYSVSFYPTQKKFIELLLKERFNLETMTTKYVKEKTEFLGMSEAIELLELINNDPTLMLTPVKLQP
ncbi:MAG: signal peptide peptidase SppA [Candidatus Cloacimonetes bacterium]|nr:signal peptide peptidase SppA [Candidatus Cloacimonadota bacterium]